MIITKEFFSQLTKVLEWADKDTLEFQQSYGTWTRCPLGRPLDITHDNIHRFRETPRKVVRNMTVEEVMALGHFTLKVGDDYYHGIYHFTKDSLQKSINLWVREKAVYSTDGCKTWNLFTVTEEVAK